MNIYVVRHGQTDWNKQGILLGNTDKELNETGREQAIKLKDKLKKLKFDYIITSPLKRAMETTKIISKGERIIKNNNLKERNYGELEGTSPENINEFWKVSTNLKERNVEPIKEFLDKIFKEMDTIIQNYNQSDNLLIVTHYGVVMAIDAYFNEKFDYCFDNFLIDNCEYKKYEVKTKK